MNGRLLLALLRRECGAFLAHRTFLGGWIGALLFGIAVERVGGGREASLWVLYQMMYYVLPLVSILSAIVIVRQDLPESALLAQLPSSTTARVLAKAGAAMAYVLIGMGLLLVPPLFGGLGMGPGGMLATAGALLGTFGVGVGVFIGFRARHEVRAYLGGLALWVTFLIGSGAIAYVAHLALSPQLSAVTTLASLMANPVESFRIFVFFGLSAVPMNPHNLNPLAEWWMVHPLLWLGLVTVFYAILSLITAGWNLRFRVYPR